MSFLGHFARILAVFALLSLPASAGTTKYQGKPKTVQKSAPKSAKTAGSGKKRVVKPPPPKKQVATAVEKDLSKTFDLIRNNPDPVGGKLLKWIYVTETTFAVETHQMIDFVRNNPDWPRLYVYKRKIEDGIAAELKPDEIIQWFEQFPPTTYNGGKAFIDALLKTGQEDRARTELAKFWQTADLGKNQISLMATAYQNGFVPGAHAARLDHMIWEERWSEAEYMLAFVRPELRAAAQARIALARMAKNGEQLLAAVPAQLQNSEGVLYERLRWRRRKNMDDGAAEILKLMPAKTARPDKWWTEINVLVRRKIEKRDYAGAYALGVKHQLTDGFEFAQAEWLLGWMKLRFLKDPVQAYKHFDAMYKKVGTAISLSRAAYWAARAAELAVPDKENAKQWDRIAAQYPSTFYGQLSYEKIYGRPKHDAFKETPVPAAETALFNKNELARAARLLHGLKLDALTDTFLARLVGTAKTKDQYNLVAGLARDMSRYYYAVQANKDCQQTLGQFLFFEGYPTLPPLPLQHPEKSLVHAIIHRESMFNPQALSPMGARGLMQLMPGTAKMMAKKTGERFNADRLMSDPRYNALLGSTYLHGLVDDYDGFYPMAIGAYNAGPGNVREWVDAFGDPRRGSMNIIDWIEHIPIYETRNYIQRVMESYYMYRMRFGMEPRTVYDFMPKG